MRSVFVVACAVWAAGVVLAQGTATPPPIDKKLQSNEAAKTVKAAVPAVVDGVRLASLCNTCAVVNNTRVEKRKGEAKGVGAVGGAVVGGVVGDKVGDSTGATVAGAAVGGVVGHQLEKRLKRYKVWITTVTLKDGTQKSVEAKADPGWVAGTVVEVTADGTLKTR
jgi:outer membrane lipoprotein SlyB